MVSEPISILLEQFAVVPLLSSQQLGNIIIVFLFQRDIFFLKRHWFTFPFSSLLPPPLFPATFTANNHLRLRSFKNNTKHFYSSSSAATARFYLYSSTAAAAMVVHTKDEPYLAASISKRVRIFEWIQEEQQICLLSPYIDLIKVLLPDGNVKEGKKW
uniref:Threonine--tRNA ligase, mitochondrial 1-like n=1 Tax=Cicer arietinum TaxID=3827 RepID=A0A3Q7Y864_CICAR|nr:threonine--tRNA ligase, mitochondrial 1-like [Cicer arietinum]